MRATAPLCPPNLWLSPAAKIGMPTAGSKGNHERYRPYVAGAHTGAACASGSDIETDYKALDTNGPQIKVSAV